MIFFKEFESRSILNIKQEKTLQTVVHYYQNIYAAAYQLPILPLLHNFTYNESRDKFWGSIAVNTWTNIYSFSNLGWLFHNGFVKDTEDGFVYKPLTVGYYAERPPPLLQPKSSGELLRRSVFAVQKFRRLLVESINVEFYGILTYEVAVTNFYTVYSNLEFGCQNCYYSNYSRTATYFNGQMKVFYRNQTVDDIIDVEKCEFHVDKPDVLPLDPPSKVCKRNQKGRCGSGPLEF